MNAAMEHAIAREAGMWLFRLKDDDSAECHAQFNAWLQTSPQHVAEFLLVSATDVELGSMESQQRTDIDALLKESALNVMSLAGADVQAPDMPTAPLSARRRWRTWAAAAGLAAAIGLVAVLWQSDIFDADSYRTGVGEQRAIKLPDGSLIQLNTRSQVEVRFTGEARTIDLLHGEALFTAAPDPSRPFRVRSGSTTIQAVGTQFNVYRKEDGATVSVLEGRVRISSQAEARHSPLLLDSGQQAAVELTGRIVKSPAPEVNRALAWRARQLEFRSATVAEVAAEFNRYNRLQLRVEDPDLAARRMSGRFNADDPQSLLDFLANEGGLRLDRGNDSITLRADKEPTRPDEK